MGGLKIRRLAIANRGEVAVRIIRACEELGIETVLLHSDVDVQTRGYRMATKTVCVGPAPTNKSYLNMAANIEGAITEGAQAIHPGFGFLSENAIFAEACARRGLIFVGPSPSAIRQLGDKVSCKALAKTLGIPLVHGYEGEDQSLDRLLAEAEKIGYPVIVKAAAGGGGRGMKILREPSEALEFIESAQREAVAAFGSGRVFLEKYLDRAKHIEFQIFGDATGKVIHLLDRECSVQRRHQKIIEESISPSLSWDLRQKMGETAVLIAEAAGYRGAGTVEFLYQDSQFYLLEVNTRLQVEHPVTEMVMGVDLVKAQILTAQGEAAFEHWTGSNGHFQARQPHGHAIECRIYAENPFLGGIPSTGKLMAVEWPEGPGRRFEYGFEQGDEVSSHYDPMIAKVVVWDETRPRAIKKMKKVLSESIIFGVYSNIPLLQEILSHGEFVKGTMTTRFMETYFSEPLPLQSLTLEEEQVIKALISRSEKALNQENLGQAPLGRSPFERNWRGI